MLQNKSYSLVNIIGLIVGIAACLLIFLVLQYEQSFDNFHAKKNQIYRVVREGKNPVGREYSASVPYPVTEALRNEYPQVQNSAAIYGEHGVQVLVLGKNGETIKKFKEENILLAEPRFFKMFDFKMLVGAPETAINEPNTIILTKAVAIKYFGDWRNATGKTLKIHDQNIKVTGISENPPVNTDFPIGLVASYSNIKSQEKMTDWVSIADENYCFVQLPVNYPENKFEEQLKSFVTRHMPPEHAGYNLLLQPLTQMHYDTRFDTFTGRTFSKDLITALNIIGLFLLVVACINFINLSTAQAINRAKEVGVRKVLGGNRGQLFLQFLGETGITCFIALLVSVILAVAALPLLNNLLEVQLSFNFSQNSNIIIFLAIIFVATTTLSGFYPAIILSGFNPIAALKSKTAAQSNKGISLRRGLVVLQFTIAQILIIGTIVVVSQMNYFKNADIGFKKAAIINVPFPGDSLSHTKLSTVYNLLTREPGVQKAGFSTSIPTRGGDVATDLFLSDNHTNKANLVVSMLIADTAYLNIYKFQLVAGRFYFAADTIKEFLVNETLVKKLGLGTPQNAIGKTIKVLGRWRPIVGVLKDFHVNSLRDPTAPIVLTTFKSAYYSLNIQLEPGKTKQALSSIEAIWNKNYPDYVFQYNFVDQTVADFYKQENQLSQLYTIFSAIAVFISCLGLYGLISFMAVRKHKEIGIRKVLGASVANIVLMLSREFTILTVLAFVIACPVAWYFMHQWLQQYTFRINLGAGIFVSTIFLSLIIAWATVGYSAVKAAIANPVRSLRTE